MINISSYSVELVKDPFGILDGKRFEFFLELELDEEDELFTENGVEVRVIYQVGDNKTGIVKYDLLEKGTAKLLDFDLEEDEEQAVEAFCKEHWSEGL